MDVDSNQGLPLLSYITLGQWLHFSESSFPHLENRDHRPTSWDGVNEIVQQYLSSICYMPGAVLDNGELVVNKTKSSTSWSLHLGGLDKNLENQI